MRNFFSIVLLSCFLILNASAKEKSSNSKADSKSEPTKQEKKFFDAKKVQYCNFGTNFKIEVGGDSSEEVCVWDGKGVVGESSQWKKGKDFDKALNYASTKAKRVADEALKSVKRKYPYPITSKSVDIEKAFTCSNASNYEHDSFIDKTDQLNPTINPTAAGQYEQSKITKKYLPASAIPFEYQLTGKFTDVPVSVSCADIQSALEQNVKIEADK